MMLVWPTVVHTCTPLMPSPSTPLLRMQNSPHFEGGLHLVNRREGDAVVLSFRIDNIERSTMAKNFENDLREMIWQTGAAEVSRLHRPNLSGPGPVGQLASSAE